MQRNWHPSTAEQRTNFKLETDRKTTLTRLQCGTFKGFRHYCFHHNHFLWPRLRQAIGCKGTLKRRANGLKSTLSPSHVVIIGCFLSADQTYKAAIMFWNKRWRCWSLVLLHIFQCLFFHFFLRLKMCYLLQNQWSLTLGPTMSMFPRLPDTRSLKMCW